MFWSRLFSLRQSLAKRNYFQTKCFSSVNKTETKADPKVREIKDFVLNQSKPKSDSTASDVTKPVLLYANENTAFFRKLFTLNVFQLMFWLYFTNQGIGFMLNKPKPKDSDAPVLSADIPIVDKVKHLWKESRTALLLTVGMAVCGQISMTLVALFCTRSVRYIILKPGGNDVRITTFSITGSANRYRTYDLPLDKVSAYAYRDTGVSYIPLKLKNKWFYFLIDSKGHFYKPALFDHTVGVFRIIK